jgi:hypothetical protein
MANTPDLLITLDLAVTFSAIFNFELQFFTLLFNLRIFFCLGCTFWSVKARLGGIFDFSLTMGSPEVVAVGTALLAVHLSMQASQNPKFPTIHP